MNTIAGTAANPERRGKIVKWVGEQGWGIINSYVHGQNAPQKFFFHVSWVKSEHVFVYPGCRVTFHAGPPRTERELPTALDIILMDAKSNPELSRQLEGAGGPPIARVPQPSTKGDGGAL